MQEDKAAIVQALTDYQTAFSRHDPQSTQLYYHVPCMLIGAEGVVVLISRPEIEAFFAALMESLEARGWARSQWVEVYVKQLSDSVALVSTVAARYKADGKELERVGATYVFHKTDDAWKIAMVTPHLPDCVLQLD